MDLILIVGTFLYGITIGVVLLIFLKDQKTNFTTKRPFVSIVIAARNEENRIKLTLESLTRLDYPLEKYEIIIVDDASTDNTAAVIEPYIRERANWKLVRIVEKDENLKGKKAALKQAISQAQGEIILATDADCIVPRDWIISMVMNFDDSTSMVLGHALLLPGKKGWLDKLLQFDNLFSAVIMAATTRLGFPVTSVGRNLAYRRESYIQSGGYDQLAAFKSGDDVHLTELFRKRVGQKIRFNFNKDSFTYSKPPESVREIIFQQIRKNSKILQKSAASIALSLFLFFYHAGLLLYPFSGVWQLRLWIILIGIKLVLEFITLVVSANKFNAKSLIPFLPLMQIFYPIYVTLLGIVGVFQIYEWKK